MGGEGRGEGVGVIKTGCGISFSGEEGGALTMETREQGLLQ